MRWPPNVISEPQRDRTVCSRLLVYYDNISDPLLEPPSNHDKVSPRASGVLVSLKVAGRASNHPGRPSVPIAFRQIRLPFLLHLHDHLCFALIGLIWTVYE